MNKPHNQSVEWEKLWLDAKENHLLLNEIKDEVAKEFIRACFHKIELLEEQLNQKEDCST